MSDPLGRMKEAINVSFSSRGLKFGGVLGALCALLPASALAQEGDDIPRDFVVASTAGDDAEKDHKDGLDWRLATGATLSLSDNRSVIGQTDGSTMTFGHKIDLASSWRSAAHELRGTFAAAAALTRTPVIDEFVKSQDALDAEGVYLYHLVPAFGFFGRVAWDTPMLAGSDVRAEPTTYAIAHLDGTTETVIAQRLGLTDPLRPSTLKQSLGIFTQPVAEDPFSLELRAGGGGREIIAGDQLAVADDDTTDVIEVKELDDVQQLGAEIVVEAWGHFQEKRMAYKLAFEAMTPFLHNELPAGDERDAFELTNLLIKANLSLKLMDFASLDYSLKATRTPQLLDEFQVENQLLLTFGVVAGNVAPSE